MSLLSHETNSKVREAVGLRPSEWHPNSGDQVGSCLVVVDHQGLAPQNPRLVMTREPHDCHGEFIK